MEKRNYDSEARDQYCGLEAPAAGHNTAGALPTHQALHGHAKNVHRDRRLVPTLHGRAAQNDSPKPGNVFHFHQRFRQNQPDAL